MTFRVTSWLAAVLILGGVFAGRPTRAAGIVNTCNETALLNALTGGGLVTFSCSGTITLTAPIVVSIDTAIDGVRQHITISGGGLVQIFTVVPGATLKLNRIAMSNGYTTLWGAAIINQGSVVIAESDLSENAATFLGGAVFNFGTLTVKDSIFSNNSAPVSGGGAILNDGTVTISNSAFLNNSANSGGAIDNSSGTLLVTDSLFLNNTATDIGGGILNDDTTEIKRSVFWSNTASSGGGVDDDFGTLLLTNSILVSNTPENCAGNVTGQDNLSSDNTCPGFHFDRPTTSRH